MTGIALTDRAVEERFAGLRVSREDVELYIRAPVRGNADLVMEPGRNVDAVVVRKIELRHAFFRTAEFEEFRQLTPAVIEENDIRTNQVGAGLTLSAASVIAVARCAFRGED